MVNRGLIIPRRGDVRSTRRNKQETLRTVLTLSGAVALMAGAAGASPLPPSYVPDLEPPNPVVGECYARVEIPAQYEAVNQTVLKREGHKRLMVQPPQLESRVERVMVKEPSVRYVVRQPTYKTVQETIMTRPAYDKLSVSEPVFQTVTETLQTGKSRLVWKRGNPAKLRAQGYIIHSTADAGSGGKGYTSTTDYARTGGQRCLDDCVIWCLVEEPGDNVTVTRQVMSHAGQVHRTPVAPEYKTITKQVVADPGGVEKVPVPAEYKNIHVEKLIKPASTATITVPPEYGQAQGRRLVSEARYEWRRIACKPGAPAYTHARPPVTSQTIHSSTVTHSRPSTYVPTQKTYKSHSYSSQSSSQLSHQGTHQSYGSRAVTTSPHVTYSGPAYSHTYSSQSQTSEPVERARGVPDANYQGPAYAIPPDGASHPYAVRRGAARERWRW